MSYAVKGAAIMHSVIVKTCVVARLHIGVEWTGVFERIFCGSVRSIGVGSSMVGRAAWLSRRTIHYSKTALAFAAVQKGRTVDQLVFRGGFHAALEGAALTISFNMDDLADFMLVHIEVSPC